MPWESRFQVCDPVCGLVDVSPYKREATARAKKHAMECDSVTVYDLMAKRGAANNWDVRGGMIRHDWFQAVADQPVKARFGALGRDALRRCHRQRGCS